MQKKKIQAARERNTLENGRCSSILFPILFFPHHQRPLRLFESFIPERDGDPISSRPGLSLACWPFLVVLSGCVGESGSGRFVLRVPGALSPIEVVMSDSLGLKSADGGLRRLTALGSPIGLADRSGIMRLILSDPVT